MLEANRAGRGDPQAEQLAARAIEVLVTHNEPVSREDLACALGVSGAEAWAIATTLESRGYARLDQARASAEATPRASEPRGAEQSRESL